MRAALDHRGPDDAQLVQVGDVLLVHTRLAVVDLSAAGRQPMRHPDGRWLSFNGEIFDHLQLRERLPAHRYTGQCDTETLLHALSSRGLDALPLLNGFFAFAYVEPDGKHLHLVRDRLGVKPLYWAREADRIVFASELKALLAAGISRNVDADALRFSAAYHWAQGGRTPFSAVRHVLPGHVVTVDLDTLTARERPWYRLGDSVDPGLAHALGALPRAELRELLDATLQRAIARRLSGDAAVGVLCSGGIDSSLITTLAARSGADITAYVASVPDQSARDEAAWARRVCDAVGAPLTVISLNEAAWREHFVSAAVHFEHPLWHESSIALSAISQAASNDGRKVLLGGEGADELLGGYEYKHAAARSAFATSIAEGTALRLADPSTWVRDEPLARSFATAPSLPEDAAWRAEVLHDLRGAYAHHDAPRRELEATLGAELQLFLVPSLSRLDKNVMQHGVEYREPFLDHEMLRLGLNLPLECRVLPSVKGLLREVAERHLPPAVLARSKLGFSFDPEPHLQRHRRDFLANSRLPQALGLTGDAWARAIAHAPGRTLFRLLALAIWFRVFVEAAAPDAVTDELWANG